MPTILTTLQDKKGNALTSRTILVTTIADPTTSLDSSTTDDKGQVELTVAAYGTAYYLFIDSLDGGITSSNFIGKTFSEGDVESATGLSSMAVWKVEHVGDDNATGIEVAGEHTQINVQDITFKTSTNGGTQELISIDGNIVHDLQDSAASKKWSERYDSGDTAIAFKIDSGTSLDKFQFEDAVDFVDAVTIDAAGSLEVDGASQFDGAVTFNGAVTFGADLDVSGFDVIADRFRGTASSDFYLEADGASALTLYIQNANGGGSLIVDVKGDIIPNADSAYDLGSVANKWQNIFTDSMTIDSLTISTSLVVSGTTTLGLTTFDGNVTFDGVTVDGSNSTFSFGATTMYGHIIPNATTTYNLGSATKYFDNTFVSTVNLSAAVNLTDTGNILVVNTGMEVGGNFQLNSNWFSNDGDNEGIRIDNSGNVGINAAAISTSLLYLRKDQNSGTALTIQNATDDTTALSNVTIRADGAVLDLIAYATSYNIVAEATDKSLISTSNNTTLAIKSSSETIQFYLGSLIVNDRVIEFIELGTSPATPGIRLRRNDADVYTIGLSANDALMIGEGGDITTSPIFRSISHVNGTDAFLILRDTTSGSAHGDMYMQFDAPNQTVPFSYEIGVDTDNEKILITRDGFYGGSSTDLFSINLSGLIPATDITIHAAAQNGAPTSNNDGALWLDTDDGANGTLKCYSNGAWRTVQAF